MTPELSHRLADALQHRNTPEERITIVEAAEAAEVFEDLPEVIQALVIQLESRPMPDPAPADLPAPTRIEDLTEEDLLNGGMAGAILASR